MITLALAVVVAGAAVYIGYRYYTIGEIHAGEKSNQHTLEPEVVKQKTERWSEEAAVNPAFPPGEGSDGTQYQRNQPTQPQPPSDDGHPGSADASENPSQETGAAVDTSEMQFNWRTDTGVTFDDIGGMQDIKDELAAEVIRPLENPEKAEELGVAAPNVIFHGPPGTGKTYTAEALATELGLPFVSLSGGELQSKWINESATTVNELFTEAQQMAAREGGSVVFLDELDSVLKARSGDGASHEEDNKVVNEFLNHLEDTSDHNIVFIGATNRLDALDDAGIRSGRIGLKIYVGKPDEPAREAILRAQLDDRQNDISDIGIAELAAATDGVVAADLELLVNRAAKNVLAREGDTIRWVDVEAAVTDTPDTAEKVATVN